ncbi:MAG: flagellar hook-length control protein FliK [Alicyclobacillus macrosporangiidus]|uniref:flagellar hook-length control protein FliK n=1 Tax=Alicyclobacillus macrosporangiidus TaxID=392015 RepID=UPI0026EF3647|nr:flagellar hook-length control protein FliK [Alicyclobacillus macrosporangiidus]MCL6600555.1 flagellar hook-length control protein FliK [Alicyclobacillus macrosporangiidus]
MRVMAGAHAAAGSKAGARSLREQHTSDGNRFLEALMAAGALPGLPDGTTPVLGETSRIAEKGAVTPAGTSSVQGGSTAHAGRVAAKLLASPGSGRDGSVHDGMQVQDGFGLLTAHGMKAAARDPQRGVPAQGTPRTAVPSQVSGPTPPAGTGETVSRVARISELAGDPQLVRRGLTDGTNSGSTSIPRLPVRARESGGDVAPSSEVEQKAIGGLSPLQKWDANVREPFPQTASRAEEAVPSFSSAPSAVIWERPGQVGKVDAGASGMADPTGDGDPGRDHQAPERPESHSVTRWDLMQMVPAATLNTPRTLPATSLEAGTVTTAGVVSRNDPHAPKQLAGFIVHQVEAGPDQVRVRVHPEGLGDLLVTVQRSEAGVQVQLTANQWATTQWLSGLTGQIADTVRASGVPVQMVQVTFGQTTSQTDSGGRGRHGNSGQGTSEAIRVQGPRPPNRQSAIRPDLRDGLEA